MAKERRHVNGAEGQREIARKRDRGMIYGSVPSDAAILAAAQFGDILASADGADFRERYRRLSAGEQWRVPIGANLAWLFAAATAARTGRSLEPERCTEAWMRAAPGLTVSILNVLSQAMRALSEEPERSPAKRAFFRTWHQSMEKISLLLEDIRGVGETGAVSRITRAAPRFYKHFKPEARG